VEQRGRRLRQHHQLTRATALGRAAASLLVALAACGGGGTGSTASTTRCVQPPAGTAPGTSATLQVTDAGRNYCLRRGATLTVLLRAPSGTASWSTPATSDDAVLAPTANGALSLPIGVTGAAFRGRAAGRVTVSAVRPPCTAKRIASCDRAHAWQARVTVE
jgi:hypothetical protein